MKKLINILAFVKVVESQSFTKAADLLCQSVSATSRQISDLENKIGYQLFNREQKVFCLTKFGQTYYQYAKDLVLQYEGMLNFAKNNVDSPIGKLKIISPEPFVIPYIVPCIKTFCNKYNQIIPYVDVSDRVVDFKRENVDLVLSDNIQTGVINNTSSIIRKGLLQSNYVLCASRNYIQKHGLIKDIRMLEQHQVLCHATHLEIQRSFLSNCKSNIYVDNIYALVRCALNDIGIILILQEYVDGYLKSGELEIVLPNYELHGSISLYYKKNRFSNSKVGLFVDILAKYILDKV